MTSLQAKILSDKPCITKLKLHPHAHPSLLICYNPLSPVTLMAICITVPVSSPSIFQKRVSYLKCGAFWKFSVNLIKRCSNMVLYMWPIWIFPDSWLTSCKIFHFLSKKKKSRVNLNIFQKLKARWCPLSPGISTEAIGFLCLLLILCALVKRR